MYALQLEKSLDKKEENYSTKYTWNNNIDFPSQFFWLTKNPKAIFTKKDILLYKS